MCIAGMGYSEEPSGSRNTEVAPGTSFRLWLAGQPFPAPDTVRFKAGVGAGVLHTTPRGVKGKWMGATH